MNQSQSINTCFLSCNNPENKGQEYITRVVIKQMCWHFSLFSELISPFQKLQRKMWYFKQWEKEVLFELSLTVWNTLLLMFCVSWHRVSILHPAAPHLSTVSKAQGFPSSLSAELSLSSTAKTHRTDQSLKQCCCGAGTENSQVDNFKRNYQLLSAFPDKDENLAVLAFGSLLSDGHLFPFLVLHLLPLKRINCRNVQLQLPMNTL